MTEIFECTPAHYIGIRDRLRTPDRREMDALDDPVAMLGAYCDGGLAWTLVHQQQIVALIGAMPFWPGMAQSWALTTSLVDKYPLFFHKSVKRCLDVARQELKLHRIEASIRCDNPRAIKWHTRLGYRVEGEMTAYGPDRSNYIRMAKLWLS